MLEVYAPRDSDVLEQRPHSTGDGLFMVSGKVISRRGLLQREMLG
jgi:hypothetical protein